MSDVAAEVVSLIEDIKAAERASTLEKQNVQKISFVAQIVGANQGSGRQIVSEFVLPIDAEIGEVHAALDRLTDAADRQQAKIDILYHLQQMRIDIGTRDREARALSAKRERFSLELERAGEGRRQQPGLSDKQRAELQTMQIGLDEQSARILERQLSIDECRLIIGGMSRIEAMEKTEERRILVFGKLLFSAPFDKPAVA